MSGLLVNFELILYWNGILTTLELNYQIKATPGITGSIEMRAHIQFKVWHIDVGLSSLKSASSLLVGVLIPWKGTWAGLRTMKISLVYISNS